MNNFNNLLSSFEGVFSEYINILNIIKPHQYPQFQFTLSIDDSDFAKISDSQLQSFYLKLNNFLSVLKSIQNNHILIQGFYDKKYIQLTKIKFFLTKLKNNKSRSLHDKIFVNIFKMNKNVPLGVTYAFEEFVKGITYFSNETEYRKIPIYHRAASCGNSSSDFIKKYLKCYPTNTPENITKKQKHIYKCYIERLIFDDMFTHSFTHIQLEQLNSNTKQTTVIQQNEGHKFQLTERGHNFNSCFLGIKIKINIRYQYNFPTTLNIYFYDNNNNVIKREEYKKILYFDIYQNGRYMDEILYTRYDEDGIYIEKKDFVV